ncbi:MAG: hypothetical protein CL946_05885, partial [Ectothiorhodospiraceae bacterium]|nr:hypothetical protein [Ectothiorhodospiraceae bacterium]
MKSAFVTAFLTAILIPVISSAQSGKFPESIVRYDMLEDRSSAGFLPESFLWGEIFQNVIERDFNHRWGITLGTAFELYAWERDAVVFETHLHLNVDPNNNIN